MTYLVKSSDILQVTLKGTFDTLYQKVYFSWQTLLHTTEVFKENACKPISQNEFINITTKYMSYIFRQIIVYDIIVFRYM